MEDSDEYAPRPDVASAIGVSIATLRRWIDAGEVRAEQRGRVWYVHFADAEKRNAERGDKDAGAPATDATSVAMANLAAALRQSHAHVATLQAPAKQLLECLAEENQRLRARCAELEQRHLDMLAVYERAQTDEHARKLAELDALSRQKRLDEAFGTLKDFGPLVATMLGAHFFGGDGAAPLQEGALRMALGELTDEQAAGLARGLPAHLGALILEIRKQIKDGKQKASNGQAKDAAAA